MLMTYLQLWCPRGVLKPYIVKLDNLLCHASSPRPLKPERVRNGSAVFFLPSQASRLVTTPPGVDPPEKLVNFNSVRLIYLRDTLYFLENQTFFAK